MPGCDSPCKVSRSVLVFCVQSSPGSVGWLISKLRFPGDGFFDELSRQGWEHGELLCVCGQSRRPTVSGLNIELAAPASGAVSCGLRLHLLPSESVRKLAGQR